MDHAALIDDLPRLMRIARALGLSHHDAEDLVQTTVVRTLSRWDSISADPHPYLRRVMTNLFIDRVRRRSVVTESSAGLLTDEEDQLRQRLSQAYPTEPASPAFLRQVTATVAAHGPSTPAEALSVAESPRSRSWWIAAAAAVVVVGGVISIGLTVGPGPADSAAVLAGSTEAATTDTFAPVTVTLPTSEWTSGMIALAALAQGELVIGTDGCLHIGGTVRAWPQGVYGVETAPGVIEVYGPDGLPRIRTGEILTVGGGGGGTDPAGCTSENGTPFNVMDEGFVSGDLGPTDHGSVTEPSEGSAPTTTAGG